MQSDNLLYDKYKAIQAALGNYGDFKSGYVNIYKLLGSDNQNWNEYEYNLPDDIRTIRHGRIEMDSPIGWFINNIRNAENKDDVKKQLELWNSYKPLDLPHNGESYVNHFLYGLSNAPYGGSRPVFPTTDGSNPVQTTAGGTQGTQGVQGAQAGNGVAKDGNAVARSGVQGSNNGSGGTFASPGVPKGGTKTIGGYDPNPGNVSLAYAMRNAPEQERRAALIDKWNAANGISYVTGKDGLIYRRDPQHPNGYVDPFKNDLSKTGSTYASTGIGNGGMYATGEGIKDANGNVLTNPGGNWEYQYALKNPQYGLGMMGKMSDAQRNYLQAVSNNMGYNYNFTGATRFV